MRRPLDEQTHERVRMVMDRARFSGASIPTKLNDAGLLWTPEREHGIRVSAIRDLFNDFRNWQPHEYLRTVNRSLVNCTPTDMYIAIHGWLQKYLEHATTRDKSLP